MSLIFLEYKPLCSEREFSNFWQFVSKDRLNDGMVNEARLFKIREGLFIGMVGFEPENRSTQSWKFMATQIPTAAILNRSVKPFD